MGRFLSYTTSTAFLLGLLFVLYEGFEYMPLVFRQIFGVLLGLCLVGSMAAFFTLKLVAMHRNDVLMVSQALIKKPVQRRVTQKKEG